ncbi:MAG TPA: hypothetical protein VGL06_22495 [Pseudonocardiaceae bacterium]
MSGGIWAPLRRRTRLPIGTASPAAISPATRAAEPITTAFASRTWPRRGLAASVVRINGRRYSLVTNSRATTITVIRPANPPMSARWISVPAPDCGAMSPDPITVNRPPDSVKPAAR